MDGIGRDLGRLLNLLIWAAVIFIPLGLWKLAEIAIGLFHHRHWR